MSAVLEPRPKSSSVDENKKVESCGTNLCVKREDIQFYNIAPDCLRIEVTVRNGGNFSSAPVAMQLQFAAFGAFVPWTPLQQLRVPQIKAGQSKLVSTEARIRPDGTLVALSGRSQAADLPTAAQRPTFLSNMASLLNKDGKQPIQNLPASLDPNGSPRRDIDTPRVDLHQGRSVHWVGNINVLMGNVDVERHEARAFRIYPGKINRSWFFLGNNASKETYKFDPHGSSYDWEIGLYSTTAFYNLSAREQIELCGFSKGLKMETYPGELIKPGEWNELHGNQWGGSAMVAVEICPPKDASEGSLGIHVSRQSDNRTAVVEFDFSETALGPGCYTV